jgi:hypothetical protein
MFNFHSNLFSQATRKMAKGSFFTGLFLIGFGMLVFVLRDLFAFIAAAIFFMAGFSAIGYAIKLFWATRQIGKPGDSSDGYRDNVRIHYHEEHFDT